MKSLYPHVGLGRLSGLFGISRQAYYFRLKQEDQKQIDTAHVIEMIKAVRSVHPRLGTRKLYQILKPELQRHGLKLGRDKLFKVMSDNQLLIRKRRKYHRTTNSNHWLKKYENLITDFRPYQANQLWVSDITYIRAKNKFYYLFLITDAYSRKVVGYKLGRTLETKHAIESLQMALDGQQPRPGLIHHSDRGIQYCSSQYVKLLQDYGIEISMTQDGNPLDNAIAERVNGILKDEYLFNTEQKSFSQINKDLKLSIYKYNQLRPHLSCEMLVPNEAHLKVGELNRKWKNYYLKIVDQ